MARLQTTRGHKYKLYKKRCSAIVRYKFYIESVVSTWNNLPDTRWIDLPGYGSYLTVLILVHLLVLFALLNLLIYPTTWGVFNH